MGLLRISRAFATPKLYDGAFVAQCCQTGYDAGDG